jgi:hypothetical protein
MALLNRRGLWPIGYWIREPSRGAIQEYPIAIYPAPIDVLYIVEKHKLVALGHQLEVAHVREKVWLHCRDNHEPGRR